jgi:CTD kinase subunit gamma
VTEIEECLKDRDTLAEHVGLSSPLGPADIEMSGTGRTPDQRSSKPSISAQRLDKKQIEQRIEEDRERHKRLRENQWAIPIGDDDAEFNQLWEETSSIGSDDYREAEEEAAQREQCAREHAEEMEALFGEQNQNGDRGHP